MEQLLQTTKVDLSAIDVIAVTQGPGLIGALLVGVAYAKALGLALNKPVVPVDHVHAHVIGGLLGDDHSPASPFSTFCAHFPALALVVSGGHTNLYLMNDATDFNLLAYSLDDACGECFDKVAKRLGLEYPGGPKIEQLARAGNASLIPMPRTVKETQRLQFSYSGLKTHMVNWIETRRRQFPGPEGNLTDDDRQNAAAAFQDEALMQLVRKLALAQQRTAARCVVIAGGVAANQRFRQLAAQALGGLPIIFPQLRYCADNGAMIAALGLLLWQRQTPMPYSAEPSFANSDWEPYSRYAFNPPIA